MAGVYSNFILNIVVVLFAVWIGGLATTIYGRIPNDIPLGPSHKPTCDHCGTEIKFKYFFPIIGYIISKGQCCHCHKKIPRVYLYLEIIIALFILLIALQFDFRGDIFFDERFITKSIFGAYLITLLFIYHTHKQIKARLIWMLLTFILLYLGYNQLLPNFIELFISVIVSYTTFFFISKLLPLEKNENVMCVILLSCCGKVIPIICFILTIMLSFIHKTSKKHNINILQKSISRLSVYHIIVLPIAIHMVLLFIN